jgi:pyroglutamyl-peptidase
MATMSPQTRSSKTKHLSFDGVTCLVTGFDAFGEHSSNPSQLIVEALPEEIDLGKQVIKFNKLVLPSCCTEAWKELKKAIKQLPQKNAILIMTGYAQVRETITIERFALNVRDYRIPDNNKHQKFDEWIDRKGPEAIRTKVPVIELQKHLRKKGFASEISNSAGTFVCNDSYYQALRYQQINDCPKLVLFMHLPPPERYDDQLPAMKEALIEACKFCSKLGSK